jgi:transposase InsO family protein
MTLRSLIQQVALEWPCYGYRRITAELNRRGQSVNRERVLRLMREDNLLVLRKRRFVHTTNSDHRLPIYPNLVPDLAVTGCDQLWVADITYIRLVREFIYLAIILDAFSRRCIGWALERRLEAELALSALRMALETRTVTEGASASLGSRRAICFRRLLELAQRAGRSHQHVASRQCLR